MVNKNWNYRQLIFETLILGLVILTACSTNEPAELNIPAGVPIEDAYFVQLDLTDRSGDTFKVSIYLDDLTADENIYQFVATVPGTYSISDIGRYVKSFNAFDVKLRSIATEQISTNQWLISDPESVVLIEYEVSETWDNPVSENPIYRMAGTSIEDDHVLLNTSAVIGYVLGNRDRDYYLDIKHPSNWILGTALEQNEKGYYIASDFDHLVDSPLLIAEMTSSSTFIGDTQVKVYAYSLEDKIVASAILNDIEQIMLDAEAFLGVLPVGHYDFLFHFSEQGVGALEHSFSSVYVLRDAPYNGTYPALIKSITAHEFFHIVTPLNIHSEIIENFNFIEPTPSAHLWLYEGVTEWASDFMQYRNGSMSLENLFAQLEIKIDRNGWYDPEYSLTDISLNSYTPEGNAQFVNIYYRGAFIACLLDIRLLELSNGNLGLRELILELMEEFGSENSFSESDFFEIIVTMTYPEIDNFISDYIKGTKSLPIVEYFNLLGIAYDSSSNKFSIMESPSAQQELLFEAWSNNN